MKKVIKKTFLFTITIILLIFIRPLNINAITNQTSYLSINNPENIEVGDLSFFNITFKDYSNTSSKSLGLTGKVVNNSSNNINYTSKIYYYDSNYNFIAENYNTVTAMPGSNDFNQMSNLTLLKEHSINEISYYQLSITINNTQQDSESVSNLTPSKNNQYKSYGYVIDKYDINIKVNENNTFDITETITAYFKVKKHGIFRTIPLKNTVTRLDGTTSKNYAKISNISVNNKYTTSQQDGIYKIQIGSPNKNVTGKQTYKIKYTYDLGKDHIKDYDELYYNIIGTDWDTVIGNITFTIIMPKDFDSSKLGFSYGTIGSTNNEDIKYTVNDNIITGRYNEILTEGYALTVRCELDEGYFKGAGKISPISYLMFIIPIISLIISFLIWYKFGHDNKVIETVEFYPPENFNSLEIGYLYKGKADQRDVISLLIYLANKGYIKISETKEKSLFSTIDSFKITKLKDYDGNNINEKTFLKGLFKKKYSINSNSSTQEENINNNHVEVKKSDLEDSFYITLNKIISNTNTKENKNKIFEKNTLAKSLLIIALIIISLIAIIIIPTLEYAGITELSTTLFICAFYLPFFAVGIFTKLPIFFRIFWLGFTIFHSSFLFSTLPLADAITNESIYLIELIIGLASIIGMIIFFKLMPKRTKYGNEILGKIKGFKTFLITAEKDKLEAMVMQDPSYFYNILPYAYVLGVSYKWIKKFESIALKAPTWYDTSDPNNFDIVNFNTLIHSTMSSAQSAMTSSPSDSSSSFSSGGGFSGGGSGGGGGGSW